MVGIFGGELEKPNFEPIPAGKYLAKLVSAKLDTFSKSGVKHIKLAFEIIGGNFSGRLLFQNMMWHTEGCVKVTKGTLDNLGFSKEERDVLDPETMAAQIAMKADGQVYELSVKVKKDPEYGERSELSWFKRVEKAPF